jgi:hypothetical protein
MVMKELSAIEKLEAVKLIMETLGYEFDNMTVDEAFNMFTSINREIQAEMRCNMLNRDYNMNPGAIEI